MAKVILVKISGPKLVPAAAVEYDEQTKSVILAGPVQMEEGKEPVHFVPASACYELDNETMTTVNTLMESARCQQVAAELLCEHQLKPAHFRLGPDEKDVTH